MPEDTDPDAPESESEVIRTLREQAKEGKRSQAEAESLRRELAFTKAGIDPDDPRQSYFVKGYQGDLTSDAIKAEAEKAGFLTQIDTSEPQGMTEAERTAFRATAEAAAAPPPQPVVEDLYEGFRGLTHRGGESPEQFGIRLAQHLQSKGEAVSYEGPFREWKGDSGIIPRPGTPNPRRV